MLIVLDTNVLVSGVLNPHGPPGRIVDQVVTSSLQVAFDDRITDEYVTVLSRPLFSFPPRSIEVLVDRIRSSGILISAAPIGVSEMPDPTDLPFAEVAVSASVDALVTGNKEHFAFMSEYGIPVLSPAELLQVMERRPGE